MNKLRCAALDDEPFALKIIADDISKISFLELAGAFFDTNDAFNAIESGHVDLLFLDIEMPGMTGIEFVNKLKTKPMIIFTTAYERYALKGFELNVIDYLMKPVPFDRFLQSAERASNLHKLAAKQEVFPEPDFFFIHSEYQKIKIYKKDVIYIEGLKDYVKIYSMTQARPIVTRINLKQIENLLSSKRFCRVHQSFIVALDKVTSTQKRRISVGLKEIPVGDKYSNDFFEQYHS